MRLVLILFLAVVHLDLAVLVGLSVDCLYDTVGCVLLDVDEGVVWLVGDGHNVIGLEVGLFAYEFGKLFCGALAGLSHVDVEGDCVFRCLLWGWASFVMLWPCLLLCGCVACSFVACHVEIGKEVAPHRERDVLAHDPAHLFKFLWVVVEFHLFNKFLYLLSSDIGNGFCHFYAPYRFFVKCHTSILYFPFYLQTVFRGYDTIRPMAGLTAEIEVLRKEMDRSQVELSNMHLDLGEVAARWHDAINYAPSQEAYEKLCEVVSQKDDIDGRIEALQNAVNEMSAGGEQMARTKSSMKDLDARLDTLISMLGAVAIEVEASGRLPQRLARCLEPMREYERKVKECEDKIAKAGPDSKMAGSKIIGAIYVRKLEKLKKNLDSVFAQTGMKLYKSGDFREIPGDHAKEILDEMEHIRLMKRSFKNTLLDQKSIVDGAQDSLMSMGAYGEEGRRLKALQSQEKQIMAVLGERFTEYGKVLSDGMQYWLDKDAPDELMQCCSRIMDQENAIAHQGLVMEHLLMERDIEIHNMKLSQLSEQMNHLNGQIQAIENQKRELQQKVDAELKAVSDLRMKQNKLVQENQ